MLVFTPTLVVGESRSGPNQKHDLQRTVPVPVPCASGASASGSSCTIAEAGTGSADATSRSVFESVSKWNEQKFQERVSRRP